MGDTAAISNAPYITSHKHYLAGSGISTGDIEDDAVTNAKLAPMAAYTVKGNATGLSANPTDIATGAMTASSPIAVDETRKVIGGAVVISHLDTAGNKHVPTGGSANQILKNSGASGTGAWGTVTENAGALANITTIGMSGDLTINTDVFFVDASEKTIGFGATPKTWTVDRAAMQWGGMGSINAVIATDATRAFYFSNNMYYDASSV